jgi:CheY-like chemotaxis protein
MKTKIVLSQIPRFPGYPSTKFIMSSPITALGGHRADAVVLCIDDDPFILDVTKSILARHGYTVLTAESGHEGVEIFRATAIDLVLVDYEMPVMKGHEVAVELRLIDSEVPVVLHSGHAQIPEIALELTDSFMPKGVEPYILVAEIAQLIMRRRARSNVTKIRLAVDQ